MKKKKIPKVSIGMPVFNGGTTLESTIKTILDQNFTDFELIISDDCSEDNTQEICQKFVSKDERVKYFRQQQNFGMPVRNFQYVLEQATGEFFMFASHDDPYHPKFISEMLEVMKVDENCAIAFCSYKISDSNSHKSISITPSSSCSKSSVSRYLSRIIDMQPALIYGMFRKNLFNSENLKLFDFFEVNAGIEMAIKGNIRIVNKYLWEWKIDSKRDSYSIYPLKTYLYELFSLKSITNNKKSRMNYFPFYFSQIKLIFKNFAFTKSIIIFCILSFYVFKKILKVLFNPSSSNIDFREI